MIKSTIDVAGYWSIVLFVNVDYDNFEIVESALTDILAPVSVIDEMYNKISYKYDSGVTFSNPDYRTSVVCINKATSREELINTISHEADHVQDTICKYYDVPLDILLARCITVQKDYFVPTNDSPNGQILTVRIIYEFLLSNFKQADFQSINQYQALNFAVVCAHN